MNRINYFVIILLLVTVLSSCRNSNTFVVPDGGFTGVAELPVFETSVQEIENSTTKVLAAATAIVEKVAALKPGEVTFENSIVDLETATWLVTNAKDRFYLLKNVSPDEQVRKQAGTSELALNSWTVDMKSRRDLYTLLKYFADTASALKKEDRRLLDDALRNYRRNGAHLPESTLQQIRTLKNELAGEEAMILKNYNASAKEQFTITPGQARGTSPKMLALVMRDADGNYVVNNSNAGIFLGYCPVEETRRIVFGAVNSRALHTNKPIMTDIIKKRSRLAGLLGYRSWADYQMEITMAGSARSALAFVQGLIDGLEPKFREESEMLRQLKVKETGDSAARMEAWDYFYYSKILMETRYNLDQESLRNYFSLDTVRDGMFRIFEAVFHLKIEIVPPPYVWATRVQLVRICDAGNGELLGYLYLDLFDRSNQGKYSNSALFPLSGGKLLDGSVYQWPSAVIVCNFLETGTGKQLFLSLLDVKTLFHEFGHALHHLLTTSRNAIYTGRREAPGDFLEAPSMFLECWADDPSLLGRIAVNNQNPADRIPADILKKFTASRNILIAHGYRNSLASCKMDLLLHAAVTADTKFDIVDYTNKILAEVYYPFPDKSSYITSFDHIFEGGYDAGYYGYLWSDVIADDINSAFANSPYGLLDATLGLKLRTEVLQAGNSRDMNESLAQFLGRPWNNRAFLQKLGIGESEER